MQVNICHRLIKESIEKGVNFLCLCPEDLPRGLYTTKNFKQGDVLIKLQGELVLTPKRESIHIGNGMHVIDRYGKYINHSFEPNVKIEGNNVIALKDINKYEEITFNYNETEINIACPFEINGVKVCGKQIQI